MAEIEPFVVDDDVPGADFDLNGVDLGDDDHAADPAPLPTAGEMQLVNTATGMATTIIDARHVLACAGLIDPSCEDIETALGDASFEALVTFAAKGGTALDVFKEAVNLALYELPFRLDRRGSWTVREDGYTINAPSPEAGTSGYDSAKLREALIALVTEKVIDRAGANRALEVVAPTASVPYPLLRALRQALDGEADMPTIDRLQQELGDLVASEPEPRLVQHHVGIKALLKIPAAKAAVEACAVELSPPKRRATVKPIANSS